MSQRECPVKKQDHRKSSELTIFSRLLFGIKGHWHIVNSDVTIKNVFEKTPGLV